MEANDRLHRAGEEAANWWALLQGEELTREEREAFVDWLRDSQTHIAEMLRLAQVHGALSHFQDWAHIGTDGSEDHAEIIELPPQRKPAPAARDAAARTVPHRTTRFIAIAAALAAVALLATLMAPRWRGQVIATERGERRQITLDDGSLVQVDPQTRLNIQFDKYVRSVRLTEGRAVFHVARSANRPFLVRAGATTVRAIGTAFGVEQRPLGVIVVTVSEGKVAVYSPMTPMRTVKESAQSRQRPAEVLLTANEQISVTTAGAGEVVHGVNSDRELAWAQGRLVLKNDTVAKVIAEFNRYNRVQLKVLDPLLAERPVSGVFDAANPEAFIAFLQNAAPVRVERDEGRAIVISPRVPH